jgi:serine protease Do
MMHVAAVALRRAALVAALVLMGACSKTPAAVGLPPFADLVDAVSPSVVNISTVPQDEVAVADGADAPGAAPPPRENLPEWMKKFLDQHAAPAEPDEEATPAPDSEEPLGGEQSLGSGFILWADGFVVTNAHVVKDAKEILVRLQDRRELPAAVVGLDEASDIALLKVDAKGLPAVKTGDSKKLRVGEWVMAIGSPFGFDYSVTAGIVSAKGRSLFTEQYVPFIQTDAAINPGNSGGPLFNLAGEVVGVNSQIYSQTGGNSGIAFAIPIDVAVSVAEQLKDKGKVTRGWLGVVVQEVTRDLAKSFGLPKAEGALVARVVPGSPSEKAGLKPGDVILEFNGQTLQVSNALPPMVGGIAPGENVPLKLLRDGKQLTLRVQVGELPDELASGEPERTALPLGLAVAPLSAPERAAARVNEGGVSVTTVEPGPAQAAGVRAGDILLSLSGQKIDSPEKFATVAGKLPPGGSVPMLIQRNGAPQFLALTVPDGKE